MDAGFFLHRYRRLYGAQTAEKTASDMHRFCLYHLKERYGDRKMHHSLYRIFVYDCPPLSKRTHNPITKRAVDFARTDAATFRAAFHKALLSRRSVALRMGYLDEGNAKWALRPDTLKGLLSGTRKIEDLTEDEVFYDVRQKSVDMKIGLDIASLAFKRQVDQIVLISGDSDFVPAAKLARREGIDFILDPMWANIRADLHEHIDGLRTTCPKRGASPDAAPPAEPAPAEFQQDEAAAAAEAAQAIEKAASDQ